MGTRTTPTELLSKLEYAAKNSSSEEEKAMREAQLAGAKAMDTIWRRYRRSWMDEHKDRVREYNRRYSKKHQGKNEVVDYMQLTVVERNIMKDVDNVK